MPASIDSELGARRSLLLLLLLRLLLLLEGYLGASLSGLGRFAEAEPLLETAYRRIRSRRGKEDLRTRQALARLVTFYRRWGRQEKLSALRSESGL